MNLLYSQFLKAYMKKEINLVESPKVSADEFKLALISQDAVDSMKANPSGIGDFRQNTCQSSFQDLQGQGFEVQSENYEAGGKTVEFTISTSNFGEESDESQGYSDGLPRIFYNLNKAIVFGTSEHPVNFIAEAAIIYRVSDGLLLAYYEFNGPKTADGVFSLVWGNKHVISVKSDIYDAQTGSSVAEIDSLLNPDSYKPVTNATITRALLNLGTRLGLKVKNLDNSDDDIISVSDAILSPGGSLDELSSLTKEQVTNLFEDITSED